MPDDAHQTVIRGTCSGDELTSPVQAEAPVAARLVGSGAAEIAAAGRPNGYGGTAVAL